MNISTTSKNLYTKWTIYLSSWSQPSSYQLVCAVFLRLLALIYFAAFASIAVQIVGLAGSQGIIPLAERLQHIEQSLGAKGYWFYPTLFWINHSDFALQAIAVAGCIASITLFFNILTRISLILLFVFYLSIFHAGQIFMNFQWDYLLLEAGFLAIFLHGTPRLVIWLFRWLLFRFRFLSGASKLISGDPTWANFTALNYYFETQPLPHWLSWYAHQLPDWLLKFGTAATLFIEIIIPFLIFLPRRAKFVAAWATILLQVLIICTSNHNFVNFLTIALCLFLFDDKALHRVVPSWAARRMINLQETKVNSGKFRTAMLRTLAAVIVLLSSFEAWELFAGHRNPEPIATIMNYARPFQIAHRYHVFPTMKTARLELIIEGSLDGENWQPYEFKYKPGELSVRPKIVIPHQPRLDWMMWFVPMGPIFLPWFERFLHRLLENSPAVVALLKTNPFPDEPPQFLRISLYYYRFTNLETRKATGDWWNREYVGPFFPLPWLQRS
jgi:hypothetical protein